MSVTISTCEQICYQATNNSSTKMLWSFGKRKRFGNKRNQYCRTSAYTLPSTFNKRATSLGYGNKSNFIGTEQVPGPNAYQIYGTIEKGVRRNKGRIMGIGREKAPVEVLFGKGVPGPGTYKMRSSLKKRGTTLLGKVPTNYHTSAPGPGTYKVKPLFRKSGGGSHNTKFKYDGTTKFSTQKRFRELDSRKKYPGPGNYKRKDCIQSDGQYFMANIRSQAVSKFGRGKRKPLANPANDIGPGMYRIPSEFGYYQSREKYNQSHGIFKKKIKIKRYNSKKGFGKFTQSNDQWFST